ncbi:MAG: phosphatidate cytidylyltransferase [Planctomycetota bacterium]
MLRDRLIFGSLFVVLLVGVVLGDAWLATLPRPAWLGGDERAFPPGVLIFVVVALVAWLAALELTSILRDKGILASRGVNCAAAFAGLLVSGLTPTDATGVTAVAVAASVSAAVLGGSLMFFARHERAEGVVAGAGGALLAFIYLGLMLGFVLTIRRSHPAWLLLWVLAVTKSCDIGAYFVGRWLGRTKLIPWLSPGKTWEGLFGGVALAAACGPAFLWLGERIGEDTGLSVLSAVAAGALFAVTGQIGDLLASLLKRDAGRKDSSRRLPGFGGVLDVIDSPLLVMPVAFWWLWIANGGISA